MEVMKPGGGRQKIQANNREIQPLLLRPVYASFNTTDSVTYSKKRIGKRIGHLSEAMGNFWGKVNNVKLTIRRAYDSVNRARRSLMQTIKKEGGSATLRQ